jgi:hypothetical protein
MPGHLAGKQEMVTTFILQSNEKKVVYTLELRLSCGSATNHKNPFSAQLTIV